MTRIYLSARGWGDYSPVEWTGDLDRPEAEIVAECQVLLARAVDVDEPTQSDEQIGVKILLARQALADAPRHAAEDAGNRSAREAGRQKWARADYIAACEEFARLWPAENDAGLLP